LPRARVLEIDVILARSKDVSVEQEPPPAQATGDLDLADELLIHGDPNGLRSGGAVGERSYLKDMWTTVSREDNGGARARAVAPCPGTPPIALVTAEAFAEMRATRAAPDVDLRKRRDRTESYLIEERCQFSRVVLVSANSSQELEL